MLRLIFNRMSSCGTLSAADSENGMERREAHRIYTSLAIEYRVNFQDGVGGFGSRATIRNISPSGAYLECDDVPPLNRGQVGHFTFSTLEESQESTFLAAKAKVCRVIRHIPGSSQFGLALEFISGPLIFYQERNLIH